MEKHLERILKSQHNLMRIPKIVEPSERELGVAELNYLAKVGTSRRRILSN